MAVGLSEFPEVVPVPGIRLGTATAGVGKPGRRDLVLIELVEGATCAGVFTRNAFCAAPVLVARKHLAEASPRFFLINSGNANAGTGDGGLSDALSSCELVAELAGCDRNQVLPFSTGVIGEPLNMAAFQAGVPQAYAARVEAGWYDAAHGIMTTDTVAKGCSRQVTIADETVTVTGIAKGAGMIRPDMATMLAFITTDAPVSTAVLQTCLRQAVRGSFNCITVDGDTSTNDACMLVATGKCPIAPIASTEDEAYQALLGTVTEVCAELAQAIVRDGEGATRFITIDVVQGASGDECEQVAYTIAHSPLVKTAFFAGDPNWGRILAAVGRAGVRELDLAGVNIYLGDVCIVRAGARASEYQEQQGQAVMGNKEVTVRVELGRGNHAARVWTSDLSYEYVRINAEYRT